MNLNPSSPFSDKPLSEIDAREGDAWCAQLLGWWGITLNADDDDWTGCHPANTVDQNILNYHSSWAAAGPLMEREEFAECHFEIVPVGHFKEKTWKISLVHPDYFESIPVHGDIPLAIRNAFIIAATHAKEQQSPAQNAAQPGVRDD